jgi:hypothetical protein
MRQQRETVSDMDRTPEEMLEDSSMWSRAGYPAVAVGRYREAADQLKRLAAAQLQDQQRYRERLNHIEGERDGMSAKAAALNACVTQLRADLAARDATIATFDFHTVPRMRDRIEELEKNQRFCPDCGAGPNAPGWATLHDCTRAEPPQSDGGTEHGS